jgi:hypothetical protein
MDFKSGIQAMEEPEETEQARSIHKPNDETMQHHDTIDNISTKPSKPKVETW